MSPLCAKADDINFRKALLWQQLIQLYTAVILRQTLYITRSQRQVNSSSKKLQYTDHPADTADLGVATGQRTECNLQHSICTLLLLCCASNQNHACCTTKNHAQRASTTMCLACLWYLLRLCWVVLMMAMMFESKYQRWPGVHSHEVQGVHGMCTLACAGAITSYNNEKQAHSACNKPSHRCAESVTHVCMKALHNAVSNMLSLSCKPILRS